MYSGRRKLIQHAITWQALVAFDKYLFRIHMETWQGITTFIDWLASY